MIQISQKTFHFCASDQHIIGAQYLLNEEMNEFPGYESLELYV